MTGNEATPDDATDATPDEAAAPENDVKAKFREALARKNARHHATAAGDAGDSKVHAAHGPASHTKQFRRKAGG